MVVAVLGAFLTSDIVHYIQTHFIKNRFNIYQKIDILALVRSHKDSYILTEKGQRTKNSVNSDRLLILFLGSSMFCVG
jgi:hypothetical protein